MFTLSTTLPNHETTAKMLWEQKENMFFKLRTDEKIKGIKLALLRVIIFKGIYDFGNAHTSILSIYPKL